MTENDPSKENSPSNGLEERPEPPDTGYTVTDDPWIRFRNTWRLYTGGLTEEGIFQYIKTRDERFEKEDCARCEKTRDYLFQYSPIIRYLNKSISALGGDLHKGNVRCLRCTERRGGGFNPTYGILLCANRPEPLEDTLAHEMVHAYDHLRFKTDMVDDLRHAACAEIRASSLSGECRFWREFWHRSQWKLTYQHQECVKRRATISVAARPGCKDDKDAAKVVNEVWDSCFADTRPFDEIYK